METATEFLRRKKIITAPHVDLMIGFTDGSEEKLTELLDEYHQEQVKNSVVFGDVIEINV